MQNEANTALATEILIDVETLNTLPLADVFIAVGPAKVVAEGVSVGPVVTDEGNPWFLVRFDGKAGPLKASEAEALEAAGPAIRRHVGAIEFRRGLAKVATLRAAEKAARIAACPKHFMVERKVGRGHVLFCKLCGFSDGIDSAD